MSSLRKIIHFDMDAFYASIEQRDHPELKGKPVIVGGDPHSRGVVATCSYEARTFGIHSAMPARRAYQLCPQATFLRPRMDVYKTVSSQIMNIFKAYTDLVEPLSLDEAFLDVTYNKHGIASATRIAQQIKKDIYTRTKLSGSAGVSINKFVAKIASDYQKPDGLTVVTPENIQAFLDQAPIRKFFGVGKVTEQILHEKGIYTGYDFRQLTEAHVSMILGERGRLLYNYVRGIDERPVNPHRIRKSFGKETTLHADIYDVQEMMTIIETLAEKVEVFLKERAMKAKVVTLKIRFNDFHTMTRRKTISCFFQDAGVMLDHARDMLEEIDFQGRSVRLLGISASDLISENDPLNTSHGSVRQAQRYEQLTFFNDF